MEEPADGDTQVKQRKGRQATGERKIYNMRQRNRGDIGFEAERIEDYVFAMKQGNQGYIQEDECTEKPDLTLGNVDCMPRSPNNISSLLGTTIRNNDANQNIVGSVKYFVPNLGLNLILCIISTISQIVKVTLSQVGDYTD